MTDFMGNVKTINSAVRTALLVGIFAIVGYGGWYGYTNYVQPGSQAKQAIADLEALKLQYEADKEAFEANKIALKAANEDNERLATSMKLLKIQRRVANLTILEKGKDVHGNPYMEVAFTEVDEQGKDIGSTRNYVVKGEKLYVDGWIVTFDDKYVEEADELRSASMYVFKSIYGDHEKPSEGQSLDMDSANGGAPGIYKSAEKRAFEDKIWGDFWKVSNDIHLQKDLGIRAVHGLAPYIQPEEGKTYQVHMRASGGMTLNPIEEP